MTGQDLRLLPIALAAWGTALLCVFLPAVSPWWSGGCLLAAFGCAAAWRRGRGPYLAVACAVGAAVALTCAFAAPARETALAADGRVVTVVADITSSSSTGADGSAWFDAQAAAIRRGETVTALSVPVRIGVAPVPGVDLGARIEVVGQAMATDGGERAGLVIFASDAEIIAPASGVYGIAADVREDFVDRAVRLPEPGAGLLPGLAVGDTRAVSDDLNAAMLTSGLSHLTAVSGANCAIVVGAVFWVVALCGGGRRLRVGVALTGLAAFVILVTPEPSVIRAAVMAGLAMLTVLLGRPSAGVTVLCAAVTGILLADPWLAATPGFALSAAATGGLILLAPRIARGLARVMPQPLALAIAIPLAAQIACGPIIALFAPQQSLIGIVANMLAAPAAPLATVIGLLACLASPIPPLADLFAASAWLPAAWIATTATTAAALPGAQLLIVPGLLSAALVVLLSVAVCVLLWRARSGAGASHRIRAVAAGILVIACALGGARMLMSGPLAAVAAPQGWSVAACDVGQGDAALVRSAGRVALIDTGPDADALRTCLSALGIGSVDLLVLTHFDLDHVGGVDAVVGRVATVLHGPPADAEDERTLASLREGGADLIAASAGQTGMLGMSEWRVFWPRAAQVAFPPGNDTSVVIEFDGAEVPRSVFLGDLSATPQRMLAASGQLRPPYAIVKVAHHGSADQDAALYAALAPTVALFSAGEGNDYGHPRAESLVLTESAGATTLRTDTHGRIVLGRRDGALTVWVEHPDSER